MSRCDVNLGRDFILPSDKRRRIYRAMQFYLTVCIPLFGAAVYASFLNIREADACRDSSRTAGMQIDRSLNGMSGLLHYADQLRTQVEENARQSQAIRDSLPSATHTILPLMAFVINRSGRSDILNRMSLTHGKDGSPTLEFSLVLPGDRKNPGQNFLRDWQADPALAASFSSITPVTTRLGDSESEGMVIVNYRAVFKEQP